MQANSVKKLALVFLMGMVSLSAFSQDRAKQWRGLLSLGANHAFNSSGFVEGFFAKRINLPTVNVGVQYLFEPQWGVRLDGGFNRVSSHENSREFKLNYTRINAQLVYRPVFRFLPEKIDFYLHGGGGYSFVKPLSPFTDNDTAFLNAMAGIELHYNISEKVSIFGDISYLASFEDDFNPVANGYGSFNGNMATATIGISFALLGRRSCNCN